MGADLYILERARKHADECEPEFLAAVAHRNKLKRQNAEKPLMAIAQRKVLNAYSKMYPKELYFRDSYNDSSLLWQYGLSWWNDISPLCDDHKILDPAGIEQVKALLDEHKFKFLTNVAALDRAEQKYMREKNEDFLEFLERGLDAGGIECSL